MLSLMPSSILAVEPERGWTDNKAKIFTKECGFQRATLGGHSILRVNAAVVAGLGIVSAALDKCQRIGGSDDDGAWEKETTTTSRCYNSSPLKKATWLT